MRNVISAMKAAVIAAPSAIVNQSDIVFSFQEVGKEWARSSHPPGG